MAMLSVGMCLKLVAKALSLAIEVDEGGLGSLKALTKLADLLSEADNQLHPAHDDQSLLVRRGLVITNLLMRAVLQVAPRQAERRTFAQKIETLATSLASSAAVIAHHTLGVGDAPQLAPEDALKRDLQAVFGWIVEGLPDPNGQSTKVELYVDWLGPPLRTPLWSALWQELTKPTAEGQPLWLESDVERRGVENEFRSLWRKFCESAPGKQLEGEVRARIGDDGDRLWDHLAQHYAGWGSRHVFGNLDEFDDQQGIVFMPLDKVYVEPNVKHVDDRPSRADKGQRALDTLYAAVTRNRLTIVSGAMGLGKTLTARTLVVKWAKESRDAKKTDAARWMPVYVACRKLLEPGRSLDSLVTEAARDYLAEVTGRTLDEHEPRLRPPSDIKIVVVLDGFDEREMSEEEREAIVKTLHRSTSDKQRIILFTRPAVVPRELPERTETYEVLPFDEAQQNEWLRKWGELGQLGPRTVWDVHAAQRALLATPVLLLMVAMASAKPGAHTTQAALYESFMRRLARGKLRSEDRSLRLSTVEENNQHIDRAADVVLSHLRAQWKTSHPNQKPEREDAMLWILGRVALEMHRRGQETTRRELTLEEANKVIQEAIGGTIGEAKLSQVTLACVLTTHLGLRDGQEVMFFGHLSFQEYLVARAWREQLLQIVRPGSTETPAALEGLLEGLIIQRPGDRTIDFLMDLVRDITDQKTRELLVAWASRTVEDLRVGPVMREGASYYAAHTDTRAPLALAAFAIGGSLTTHDEEFTIGDVLPLQRVLAWKLLSGSVARVIAPRLGGGKSEQVWILTMANLSGADLTGARLKSVNLTHANLVGTKFQDTHLQSANLTDATLGGANLTGADLSRAYLKSAKLIRAVLIRANLYDAYFLDAELSEADLSFANKFMESTPETPDCRTIFNGAELIKSNFTGAYLVGASFSGAKMIEANLSNSKLMRAKMQNVNLSKAILSGADLTDATLEAAQLSNVEWKDILLVRTNFGGAQMRGARLLGCDLTDAKLDCADMSCANLYGSNLTNAEIVDSSLIEADLSEANLMHAKLDRTILDAAKLSTAKNLSTATLHNASFTLNHPHFPDTLWPPDFTAEDAKRAGAFHNNPDGTWPAPHPEPASPTDQETPPNPGEAP